MRLSKKFWKYSCYLLLILLVLSIYFNPLNKENNLSEQEISKITGDFLTNYILGPTTNLKIGDIEEKELFYTVQIEVDGKSTETYVTKDGQYLFPAAFNIFMVEQTSKFTDYKDVNIRENRPGLGNEDAVVTIVEFSDYQCAYCAKFTLESFNQLKEDYIDTGKVYFIHKHFPLERIHEKAFKAAEASYCAKEQDKFWEMHEKLFKNMEELSIEDLKIYANELGLNQAEFDNCLDSSLMAKKVRADIEDGQTLDITGTPVFYINGREVIGAQPYELFAQIIEEEIRASSSTL